MFINIETFRHGPGGADFDFAKIRQRLILPRITTDVNANAPVPSCSASRPRSPPGNRRIRTTDAICSFRSGWAGGFFQRRDTAVRVPARLDVMGGIADYSGANVCEATLGLGILVAVQPQQDALVRIRPRRSVVGPAGETRIPWLAGSRQDVTADEVRRLFHGNPLAAWAAYAGSLGFWHRYPSAAWGFHILLLSAVPMNAGLPVRRRWKSVRSAPDACLGLG